MTDVTVYREVGEALQPTLLDRAIGYLAPERAAKRLRARATMALVSGLGSSWGTSGYVGGRSDRQSLRDYSPFPGSASSDQLPGLDVLRARSRDLVRNAPIAGGAVNTVVTNVVGPGITLQATPDRAVLGLNEEEAEAWEARAELIWRTWIQAEICDLTGEQDFAGLQDLAFRSVLESGDMLMVRRFVDGGLFSTRLQFIEADRITNPNFEMDTSSRAAGVEVDGNGRVVAYHVQNPHPGDRFRYHGTFGAERWARVPARGPESGERQAILLYRKLRPGQMRGMPYLAPVIESLKQLSRYSEAELIAAVVSAMFTVFIKTENGGGLSDVPGQEVESPYDPEADYKLGNASIVELFEGESIETANPTRPNSGFDPFMIAMLRQVGASLELPFEVLVKHFTASYSAARSALLEAWKFYYGRRKWLATNMLQPAYGWVMAEAIARGMIDAPGFFDDPVIRQAWLGTEWVGPAKGQIDPKKEIDAAAARVELGVSSRAREAAEIGNDWLHVHRQLAREERMRQEDGLSSSASSSPPDPAPEPDDDDPDAADTAENQERAENQGRAA